MRRMHWWTAAMGAGLLGAGVLAAPAAFADHHPPARTAPHATKHVTKQATKQATKHGPTVSAKSAGNKGPVASKVPVPPKGPAANKGHGNGHGDGDGDGHGNGHGNGHGSGCDYPPHGAPSVGISVSRQHLHPNTSVMVTGTVKVNGCSSSRVLAGLYKLVKQGHHKRWVKVAEATTADDGTVTFTVAARSTETYRTITAATDGLSQACSATVRIEYRDFPHHG